MMIPQVHVLRELRPAARSRGLRDLRDLRDLRGLLLHDHVHHSALGRRLRRQGLFTEDRRREAERRTDFESAYWYGTLAR